MANNIEISMLLDLYGEALTTKQRDYLSFYYNDDLSLSEIAEHTKKGCDDLTIKEADGNENTGHHHLDNEQYMFIASNILEKNPELEDFYSVKGLADALKDYINRHHDKPIQEAISDFTEESLEDCEHFKSNNK